MQEKDFKKKQTGTVVSDKMDKTRVVVVETVKKHSVYGKYMNKRKRFSFHDQNNTSKVGDKVIVQESKPISKTKKWELVEVLVKASV